MRWIAAVLGLFLTQAAHANDWEKFYTSFGPTDGLIPASASPEIVPSTGNIDQDLETMWRRGYAAIGYTSFTTSNDKTKDASRFAKKLNARYLIVATDLESSRTASIPLTTPTTTTSQTRGTASAYGNGGYANGTYSGTTTTYGSQTSYIPITINRFSKMAVYFMELPRYGAGILPRELNAQEITAIESRRAFVVRFVRDGSPAYIADLLPGDIVTHVNGQPADQEAWQAAIRGEQPLSVHVVRNGKPRDLTLTIPPDWRPR